METGTAPEKSQAHAWVIVAAVVLLLTGWFVGVFTDSVGLIAVTVALAAGLALYGLIVYQQNRRGLG